MSSSFNNFKQLNETHSPLDQNTISLLKTKIFELEQSEKNYSLLNTQYRHLQNEIAQSAEERLQREHNDKLHIESQERKIHELKNENSILQDSLNELYKRNNNIGRIKIRSFIMN